MIKNVIKGIGNTFIDVAGRVLKIWHDDAGYFDVNGKRIFVLTTAITANSTTTTAPAGSLALTTHATGKSKGLFVSDGSKWQKVLGGGSVIAALTDSSGGATADGTIGAVTAPTALTDSSGGSASATLAAQTLPTALTHSFGTADGTLDDVTGSHSQTILNNNFKELTTAQASNRAQLAVLQNVTASLAARQAENRTAIVALTDAIKELSTKVNEIVNA